MKTPLHLSAAAPSSERNRSNGVRLYVARGTPNSDRAEANLARAIAELDSAGTALVVEVVDVFSDPKRAFKDGIIVTPTLIGFSVVGRQIIMGDLSDAGKLGLLLGAVLASKSQTPS